MIFSSSFPLRLCGTLRSLAALVLLPGFSAALEVTWTGGGADNNWSTGANWGGAAPAAGDSLNFAGTVRPGPVNNLAADISIAGITFSSGAGAFSLSGNRITLDGNVVNNSTALQTVNLALILNATRTFDAAAGALTAGGLISGNGGLIKTGSGNLTLNGSASNTYAGLTSVTAGTLTLDKAAGFNAVVGNLDISGGARVVLGKANQIGDSTLVTLSGAGSVFNGSAINTGMPSSQTETIGGLTATGGTFNAGGGAVWNITGAGSFTGGADNTLFLGNSGARISFGSLSISNMSAVAGGTVGTGNSFTLYGNSGTLSTLTVGSGGLTLDASRLNLRRGGSGAAGSRLVLNGNVSVTGTAASFISEDTAGGTVGVARLELSGTADPVSREFNVAATASLNIGVDVTNGASTQAGITKSGNGTLTLSGALANTYTGTTTVNAGTLVLGKSAGVNAVGGNIVVNTGGTLTLNANEQIPDLSGITVAGGTVSPMNRTETLAFYTQTSGGLTLSGNTGQVTITGALTLSGGNQFTLNSLSSATPTHFRAGSLVMTGADLLLGGNNGAGNPRTQFTVGSGGISMTGRTITLSRGTAGTQLNLNGNFIGNGASTIAVIGVGDVEPELNLGADTRTFDIASGTTNVGVSIAGAGGLTKTGTGTLTFTGAVANTYSGTTTVSGGTLNLNHSAGVDAVAGPLVLSTGGTLTLSANEQIANGTGITVTGGTLSPFTTTETLAYYTQNSGGFSNSGNVGNLIVTGTVTLAGGNIMTINSAGATPPAWQFNAAVLSGQSILIGGNNGAGNPKTSLTIGSGGLTMNGRNITLNGGNAGAEVYLLGDVTATGSSAITTGTPGGIAPELRLGTGTRTFTINSGTTTLGLEVRDAAAIVKEGTGTLALSFGNTYSGGTTVNAGTLLVSNTSGSATGSGGLTVNAGGTLSGNGRIAPSAGQNVVLNGIVSVGNSGATAGETLFLTTTGLGTVQIGGRVVIDLFSGQGSGSLNGAVAADRLIVASQAGATLGGGSVLNVTTSIPIDAANSAGWVPGTSWQIIDWSGLSGSPSGTFGNLTAPVGNFLNLPDLSPLGYFWDVSSLYTTGTIVVAVPEPSRWLLLVAGVMWGLARRRRKMS